MISSSSNQNMFHKQFYEEIIRYLVKCLVNYIFDNVEGV